MTSQSVHCDVYHACIFRAAAKKEMPKFLKKPDNVECLEFDNVTFETAVSGKPEPTVEW